MELNDRSKQKTINDKTTQQSPPLPSLLSLSSVNMTQPPTSLSSLSSSSSSSMAIICSSYSIIIPRVQRKKNTGRALMVHNSKRQPIKVSASLIKAPLAIKVFEDQAKGIVCYRDNKGELICEGYDEGPRLIPHPSLKTYHQRCAELQIPDFLTQRWFQILQDQN